MSPCSTTRCQTQPDVQLLHVPACAFRAGRQFESQSLLLTSPRLSFPSARPLSEPRFIGFLNANRRLLVMTAVVATGLLTSVPSLPAQAEALLNPPPAPVVLQSYTAPAGFEAPVVRDAFSISTYSVVQWPVPVGTPISSGFGLRECDGCSTNHTGTDFNPGNGFAIPAIADGVVTEAGWDSTGYGNKVVIQHNIDGQIVSTLYAHMQDDSIAVTVGQVVTRGTILGLVGETGEATGPHLHFSVIIDGTMVDPYPWLLAHVNI